MEARPAMAPVAMPTMLGLPNLTASMTSQTSAAVAAEMCVTVIAMPASAPAFSALPALKPYQPTQSMQAPTMVIQGACGGFTSPGKPARGPIRMASISAVTPAVRCTTSPPAKSSTPRAARKPPPQIQCATGT